MYKKTLLFIALVVLGAGAVFLYIRGRTVPNVSYIPGEFLRYSTLGITDKQGFVCVNSITEYRQLIRDYTQRIPGLDTYLRQHKDFLEQKDLFVAHENYLSFWPDSQQNVLLCEYFTSINTLDTLKKNTTYMIGYYKHSINKKSFTELIDFLIQARIVPTIPRVARGVDAQKFTSSVSETKNQITRTDIGSYIISEDATTRKYRNQEVHVYRIDKSDQLVTYEGTVSVYKQKETP